MKKGLRDFKGGGVSVRRYGTVYNLMAFVGSWFCSI